MKSKIFLFLLLGVILNFSLRVYFHRSDYLTQYDPDYWHDRYLKSQWVTPNSQESIGDDGLYAYAGWQYMHGADPSLLNPEMPPLGKYIIGATTIVFGNQNIQALIFGIVVLILLYNLARFLLSKTLSMFVIYLFTLEPVFVNQLGVSLLDLQSLAFLMASLLFFLKFLQSKKWQALLLSFILLGAMMAVKFFIVAFILGITYFVIFLIFYKKFLFKFFIFSPTVAIIYLLSYTGYFLNGHSFREFLSFQKWTLVFHKDSLAFAFPGGPFWMMFFNRWESWFGGLWYRDHVIIPSPDWQVTWPVVLLLTVISFFKILNKGNFKKGIISQVRLTLIVWVFTYLGFLSVIPIFPRYLLLVLPLMYILLLDALFNLEFFKNIYSILVREWRRYKKDYWYFIFFILLFALWKIPPITSGNFVFSPQFARDLFLTRNVIFGLTPLTELNFFEIFKSLYLGPFYFLADGKPQTLLFFLFSLPVIVSLIFYHFFRQTHKKTSRFLIFPTLFLFLIFYQLVWDMPAFSSGKEELIFKNEREVMDFTYRDSEFFKFSVLPLSRDSESDHYRFLYQWYETRQYHGKNVPLGDNGMHLLYVIIDPGYELKDEDREKLAKDYNGKFQFDQKFSSGIVVWKLARLDILEKIGKGKQ